MGFVVSGPRARLYCDITSWSCFVPSLGKPIAARFSASQRATSWLRAHLPRRFSIGKTGSGRFGVLSPDARPPWNGIRGRGEGSLRREWAQFRASIVAQPGGLSTPRIRRVLHSLFSPSLWVPACSRLSFNGRFSRISCALNIVTTHPIFTQSRDTPFVVTRSTNRDLD